MDEHSKIQDYTYKEEKQEWLGQFVGKTDLNPIFNADVLSNKTKHFILWTKILSDFLTYGNLNFSSGKNKEIRRLFGKDEEAKMSKFNYCYACYEARSRCCSNDDMCGYCPIRWDRYCENFKSICINSMNSPFYHLTTYTKNTVKNIQEILNLPWGESG